MAVDAGLVVPPRRLRVAVIVSGTALGLITGLLVAHWSTSRYDWLEGLGRAVTVGAPIAVGLYARRHTVFVRFGGMLIGVGLAWFMATLAGSPDEVVHSIGRTAAWCVEVAIVYVVLAFPTGRLTDRVDRVLVGAAALLVLVLYLPTALLVEAYPVPGPWDTCTTGCPANAFDVLGRQPGFVADVVYPLREGLTILLFVGVSARLGARLAGASQVMRRTVEPVLAVAIFRTAAFATALAARRVDADSEFVQVAVWVLALALPALALAFLLGLVRWRLFVASGMQNLATRLPGHAEPEQLETALADAFEDPTIEIVYWLDDSDQHWVDAHGALVRPPPEGSGRALTEVRDGGAPVAAIIHDAGLRDDDAFIATATAYALMTLDNQRLAAQTRGLLREVSESRRRIQATADDERRRIERDLHDGAQQRLVALRIKLELEAEQTERGDPERAATLRRLGSDVEDAIDEMRSLARGIYPAALADRGLVDALRGAALQSPLPTTLLAAGVGRYSREIETTAYFCCLEALQNAAKHAVGAGAAVIDLSDTGSVLRMEVRDDGAGFDAADVEERTGFVNMRDRLAAVAGELVTISSPGRGTRIVASIPLPARPERAP
jgi:signal transduction histidine kinase